MLNKRQNWAFLPKRKMKRVQRQKGFASIDRFLKEFNPAVKIKGENFKTFSLFPITMIFTRCCKKRKEMGHMHVLLCIRSGWHSSIFTVGYSALIKPYSLCIHQSQKIDMVIKWQDISFSKLGQRWLVGKQHLTASHS